jgi:hypothetical protein
VHFSRIYHDNTGTAFWNDAADPMGRFDAQNNWWGSNAPPFSSVGPEVSYQPWLLLNITAMPPAITPGQSSVIQTSLTRNSDGIDTSGLGYVPDGITTTYAVISGSGSVSPQTDRTTNGMAGTTFSSANTGTNNISAVVDDQIVYLNLPVYITPVTTPDAPGNDDGFPSGPVSPATTGAGAHPLMTVTVNIGGDSKAWQAIVTGTKLSGLIVTGSVQPGSGSNITAPPGVIFQYISLVPARYDTITKAVINFTVPQSWLDENHITPGSIVLYHQTANSWEALPTTVLYTKDGTVYFSAQSTSFSLFAIAGIPTLLTPPVAAVTQEIVSTPVQEQTPAPAPSVKAPVTMQTTAPPATAPQPAAPSPLLNVVFVIAAIGILAGGGFLARRWWIRRQNPALFREYD